MFFLFPIILGSCGNTQEKIKTAIITNVNDEFFERDSKLSFLEVRIKEIENKKVDTLIINSLSAIALNDFGTKSYLNTPKWKKLKEMQGKYTSSQIGYQVKCEIRGTGSRLNSSKSENFVLQNAWFLLDDKFQVFNSSLIFDN